MCVKRKKCCNYSSYRYFDFTSTEGESHKITIDKESVHDRSDLYQSFFQELTDILMNFIATRLYCKKSLVWWFSVQYELRECPKTRVASHATSIIPALVTKNCKISFRDNVNISSRRRDKRKTSRKHQDRSKAVRPSAALVRRICGSPGDAAPWGRVRLGGGIYHGSRA